MTQNGTDHACEYVPGDPHCVVCYELADAFEVPWQGLTGEVIIEIPGRDGPEYVRGWIDR